MDANRIAAQITGIVNNAITNPLGFLLWLTGCIAIIGVASPVLAPFAPAYIRPFGDVQKWIYVAGFIWLMKGSGR